MRVSIIVPAYRETGIGVLIARLLSERLPSWARLDKLVVVECECDDAELRRLAKRNNKVVIIKEPNRMGKAAAINAALLRTKSEILVMESADTMPGKGAIAQLLDPFRYARVGVVTGRPVPTNDRREFVGYMSHVVWGLHHIVSSKTPKGGELVAFRRTFASMPRDTVADESYVEYAVRKAGYSIRYASGAVVYNTGPTSLSSFFKQRRRVFSGHVRMKDEFGYEVSTMNPLRVAAAALEYATSGGVASLAEAAWFVVALWLEGWARLAGTLDSLCGEVPYKWERAR